MFYFLNANSLGKDLDKYTRLLSHFFLSSSGLAGQIICAIQDAGFTVNTIQLFNIEKANVEEFLEVRNDSIYQSQRNIFLKVFPKFSRVGFIFMYFVNK